MRSTYSERDRTDLELDDWLQAEAELTTIFASFKYVRRIRDLRRGVQTAGKPSRLAPFVALTVSAAGSAMAIYIGTQREATHFTGTAGNKIKAIESEK